MIFMGCHLVKEKEKKQTQALQVKCKQAPDPLNTKLGWKNLNVYKT